MMVFTLNFSSDTSNYLGLVLPRRGLLNRFDYGPTRILSLPGTINIMSRPILPPDNTDDNAPSTPVILTDDADMALSEVIQRRCFNCQILCTSAWRCSALYIGKVVGPQFKFLFPCSSFIATPTALQQVRSLRTRPFISTATTIRPSTSSPRIHRIQVVAILASPVLLSAHVNPDVVI